MATISSVTTSGVIGATATIDGTGFGGSQGGSTLLFYPSEDNEYITLFVGSWADTQIIVTVPETTVGVQGRFILLMAGSTGPGVSSSPFSVLPVPPAGVPGLPQDTVAVLNPGTEGDLIFS